MDMMVTIRMFRVRSRSRMLWDCGFWELRSCSCRNEMTVQEGEKAGDSEVQQRICNPGIFPSELGRVLFLS